jgi:hypothetical protein
VQGSGGVGWAGEERKGRVGRRGIVGRSVGREVVAFFSFLYLKKIKFQKYISNREFFKNRCMSPS